jgi:hypothetical protein
MKMATKRNASIVSLLESRRVNGTPFGLTVEKKGLSPSIVLNLRTIHKKQHVIAVMRRKETLSRNENRKNFYRRLRMAIISGSSRFLPHDVVPTPSEDGTYTSYVCMGVRTWDGKKITVEIA